MQSRQTDEYMLLNSGSVTVVLSTPNCDLLIYRHSNISSGQPGSRREGLFSYHSSESTLGSGTITVTLMASLDPYSFRTFLWMVVV